MKPTIRVLPNPYSADTDHLGRLHGRVLYEPQLPDRDVSLRFVGCRLVATPLPDGDRPNGSSVLANAFDHHDRAWVYDSEPVVVPVTPYYLMQIRQGALLCADVESHKVAFGGPAGFVPPLERLAQYADERGVCPEPADDQTEGQTIVRRGWRSLLAEARAARAARIDQSKSHRFTTEG